MALNAGQALTVQIHFEGINWQVQYANAGSVARYMRQCSDRPRWSPKIRVSESLCKLMFSRVPR